jgi:hypothetical protein
MVGTLTFPHRPTLFQLPSCDVRAVHPYFLFSPTTTLTKKASTEAKKGFSNFTFLKCPTLLYKYYIKIKRNGATNVRAKESSVSQIVMSLSKQHKSADDLGSNGQLQHEGKIMF